MVGLGAIGGVISALASEGFKLFKGNQEKKHELKLLELQKAIGDKETEKDISVAEITAQVDGLISSRNHDMAIVNTSTWVSDLRGSLRPFVTYYALIAATIFFFVGDEPIKTQVMSSFVLLLEAVIAFWFTGRVVSKK